MNHVVKIYLSSLIMTVACAKKEEEKEGTSGQAKAAFAKTSTSIRLAPTYFNPTLFGVKVTSISITTDATGQTGSGSAIWVNPDCPRVDLEDSEMKDDQKIIYKYVGIGDCPISNVNTYLDLAQSPAALNAALNSQYLPILPNKTYNYAHIGICVGDSSADPGKNLKFQTDGMDQPAEVRTGTCGFSTAQFTAPLVVTGDTKVTVTLAYDLSQAVYDYGEGMTESEYCYFNGDSSVRRCAQIPNLTAIVTADQ